MLNYQIFNKYKEFFDSLIWLKKKTQSEKKDKIISEKIKTDLKSQLFLIRDFSGVEEILKISNNETRYYKFKWSYEKIYEDILKFNLKSVSNVGREYNNEFYLIFSNDNKFILVIGYVNAKDLKRRIKSFLLSFYPSISSTFLTHDEIKQLFLKRFLNFKKYFLEYKMLIYRKIVFTEEKPQKAIDYIQGDLISKISELENEQKYIDTIELIVSEINNKEKFRFRFRYNRNNNIIWFYGESEKFIDLLNNIYYIVIRKFLDLDKRERRNTKNNITQPFILGLKTSLFSDKLNLESFLKKIEDFPRSTYAIIESGNPFLHIIMRDLQDNSMYSIKTLSHKDLMICPQIISSNSSLFRILNYISTKISEYEIIDYNDFIVQLK